MYSTVLTIHSWLRWLAILTGVGAVLFAFGSRTRASESPADRWSLFAMMALDLQMLVGLILYFALSPFTDRAMKDFSAAMENPQLRFWAVEHIGMMFGAVLLAHVG